MFYSFFNTRSEGANFFIYPYHCDITFRGAIIRVLSVYEGLWAKISAMVIIVLPSPI